MSNERSAGSRPIRRFGRTSRHLLALLLAFVLPAATARTAVAAGTTVGSDGQRAGAHTNSTAADADAEPLTLETLMHSMATTSGVVASFHETKQLALLDAPLESSGTIYFIPPDRMLRKTTSPALTTVLIDGDRFRFSNEAGRDNVDLSENPMARRFVESFIVLFNGDLDELRRQYDVTFDANDDHWTITLKPRSKSMARLIASITMRGDDRAMREMVMVEADGDRTTTKFDDVDVDHHFTPDEERTLFGATDGSASR